MIYYTKLKKNYGSPNHDQVTKKCDSDTKDNENEAKMSLKGN